MVVHGSQVCGTSAEVETDITFKAHDGVMPPLAVFSYLHGTHVSLYMQTTQVLNCTCSNGCSGFVTLGFDGAETPELPSSASSQAVQDALYSESSSARSRGRRRATIAR